jgi:hypothetical protein
VAAWPICLPLMAFFWSLNVRAARVIWDSVSKSFKEVSVAETKRSPTMNVMSCRRKA